VTDLLAFLRQSPSPYHAVDTAAQRLMGVGFVEQDEQRGWKQSVATRNGFVRRGGALIAWRAPSRRSGWTTGVNIIGAHTDSPNLRIKPTADVTSAGYTQVGVEIYGGVLNNSWLDRDLGASGRFLLDDGTTRLFVVDRPIARIPQLAIHLDREVNDRGLVLDKQLHMLPVTGLVDNGQSAIVTGPSDAPHSFIGSLAGECNVDPSKVIGHDIMLHDLTPPTTLGLQHEFIASARIDNLFSCWAAVRALADTTSVRKPLMIALFDHEEVGSSSTTGAAGPLLERVLLRLMSAAGLDADNQAAALAQSSCVSADMAHSVHPNYADRHEPHHRPIPNGGPVIKSNANQRYASTPDTAASFRSACGAAGVPVQDFVSKNSMPCGSTIGPITATRLGIDTVDIGCAMLSMHSARELCGSADADLMLRALMSWAS
jgi:aspartyl aminopeptidase